MKTEYYFLDKEGKKILDLISHDIDLPLRLKKDELFISDKKIYKVFNVGLSIQKRNTVKQIDYVLIYLEEVKTKESISWDIPKSFPPII